MPGQCSTMDWADVPATVRVALLDLQQALCSSMPMMVGHVQISFDHLRSYDTPPTVTIAET